MNEQNRNTNPNKKTYLLAGIIGTFFFVLGIVLSIRPAKLLISGEHTTGTIVGVTSHENEDDNGRTYYTYTPIIEYTCGGQKIKSSPRSSSGKEYKIGKSITLFCDPKMPDKLVISEDFIVFLVPIMGFLVLFIFCYYAISNHKQRNEKFNVSGNLLSTVVLFVGFLIFGSLLCYLVYSNIADGIDIRSLIGIIFLIIAVRLLGKGFIIKLREYLRITTAKSEIKRGNMTTVQAIVIGFQHTADVLDKSYYQIICSDGISKFDSEETEGDVSGFDNIPINYLTALKIIYDPKNPQKTLQELDAHPKRFRIPDQYEDTASRLAKQIAGGENYKHSYGVFNKKKISVGDTINVYIDPNNKKSYLVDLDFLK